LNVDPVCECTCDQSEGFDELIFQRIQQPLDRLSLPMNDLLAVNLLL
jgi:hypothetical protein